METLRKIVPWSNDEIQTFLSLVGNDKIQRELYEAARNAKVYGELAESMSARGFHRTLQQCRDKLKKLKSYYRSIKDHNGRSGANRKSWRWFDHMDGIYGEDRPLKRWRLSFLDLAAPLTSQAKVKDWLETKMEDESHSISEEGSYISDGAPAESLTASSPVPPTSPKRRENGKRKRRSTEQDLIDDHTELWAEYARQQELNRDQRIRHIQLMLDDARKTREQDAVLRREENAALITALGQLVQASAQKQQSVCWLRETKAIV